MMDVPPLIAYSVLEGNLERLRRDYASAEPWSHLAIDNFLRDDVAGRASQAFPRPNRTRSRLARLLGARSYEASIDKQDPIIREIFDELHGPRFTGIIEAITGIKGLAADHQLIGAGLHQGARGSYLRVHADHNTHPEDSSRFRRINVLIYLNPHWDSRWNGDLELWDREAVACRKRIAPKFNRCAILGVDDTAFHGYGPLRVPSSVTRNALAAYFYADVAAEGQTLNPHPTALPALHGENPLARLSHRARRAALARVERMLDRASD